MSASHIPLQRRFVVAKPVAGRCSTAPDADAADGVDDTIVVVVCVCVVGAVARPSAKPAAPAPAKLMADGSDDAAGGAAVAYAYGGGSSGERTPYCGTSGAAGARAKQQR